MKLIDKWLIQTLDNSKFTNQVNEFTKFFDYLEVDPDLVQIKTLGYKPIEFGIVQG